MNINSAKRALLDKARIIDQTDDDHWLLEPIHIALESMDELEVYKEALRLMADAMVIDCEDYIYPECTDLHIYQTPAQKCIDCISKQYLQKAREQE